MRPSGDTNLVLRKGAWTTEEDIILKNYIQKYGEGKWHLVPLKAGLNRCRKSCRLRWINYLNPNIKRGDFEEDEVDLILRLHKLLGNRWSLIAGRLPGRTANDIKNHWNTHIRPRLKQQNEDLKDCERSQHAAVSVLRPQPCTISKTLNFHTHIESHYTRSLMTSSNDGLNNACNTSKGVVSSPTVSDDMIKEYLARDGSDGVEQEDGKSTAFNFSVDDVMWNLLDSEQFGEDQTYN